MDNIVNPAFMKFIYDAADQTPQIWDQWGDGEWDDEPTINYQMKHQGNYHTYKDNTPVASKTETSSSSSFKFPNDGTCPECGEELILKNGKFGDFYSCSDFPNCRYHCSKKQYEAAMKYAKREETFYGKPKEEPKKENPAIAEVKIEVKPQRKPFTGLCKEVEYKGGVYSDPFGIRCGDCVLFSHAKLKCIFRDWDTDKDRPGCDLFIPNSLDERLELLEYLKKIRDERKQNES